MKRVALFVLLMFFSVSVFSQELTAREISNAAIEKKNPIDAIKYIQAEVERVQIPAEKRALYAFLGNLQEMTALYSDARESYAKAAAIAANDVEGMPKKSNERLVIDAVRCALCSGEGELALHYLNSAVRNSKSAEIQAEVRLYKQWAVLINAENADEIEEPLSILEAYSNLSSMKSVRQSILLTLWYVSGEKKFAETLVNDYPSSMEAAVVTGKAFVMPSPFWYFVPRKKIPDIVSATTKKSKKISETVSAVHDETVQNGNLTATDSQTEKPLKQQLGLFRDETNAKNFAARVQQKGFECKIQSETRSSGTTYYIVTVDENSDGTMGLQLKDAGFECYPVY